MVVALPSHGARSECILCIARTMSMHCNEMRENDSADKRCTDGVNVRRGRGVNCRQWATRASECVRVCTRPLEEHNISVHRSCGDMDARVCRIGGSRLNDGKETMKCQHEYHRACNDKIYIKISDCSPNARATLVYAGIFMGVLLTLRAFIQFLIHFNENMCTKLLKRPVNII